MVAGGNVDAGCAAEVGIAAHVDDEHAVVDAVFAFVQKNEGVGGAGVFEIGRLAVDSPFCA